MYPQISPGSEEQDSASTLPEHSHSERLVLASVPSPGTGYRDTPEFDSHLFNLKTSLVLQSMGKGAPQSAKIRGPALRGRHSCAGDLLSGPTNFQRRTQTKGDTTVSQVRVLVGTRKGAFILTSDGSRIRWTVDGPFFGGWEIYHVKGSPVDPSRLYASQSSGWFGQVIQRSDDGGKTWEPPGGGPSKTPDGMPKGESNKFVYEGAVGTYLWYDGTQHPWEFKRVWHLEPSLTDPNTVYAGVEDAALFRSADGG